MVALRAMEAVSNSKLAEAGCREHPDEAGFAASSGLLTVGQRLFPLLLNHHIGHRRDIGFQAAVGLLRPNRSPVARLVDTLGIDVLLDFVLH